MLELKNITKDYLSGDAKVQALKGINIKFRKSEFVSILGQSGCGKTTLLNIIGGLDRYTSGDLIINGKSTKEFKDRDWDYYRNYSVGFVFQNYNLIPHQTVLSNVELALTLSGVSKSVRRKKAKEALEKVGLGDQINKKPNQMSGGQMQRVAIARALVNDPDIILADEPTGALDTVTSVQVMDILKQISKDKLIIMVTHNPELAQEYSSRIVRVVDGKIIDDSNPVETEEDMSGEETKVGKTSMNFFTALSLSLNNLLTKKGRTILTAFAGSIGIIGIALILSLSSGVRGYISKVEEDTLSSYPITIEQTTIDMSSMMSSMMKEEDSTNQYNDNKIHSKNIMNNMLESMSTKVENNNLEEFKKYLESDGNKIKENASGISYNYNLNMNLYKSDTSEGIVKVNPSTVMSNLGMGDTSDMSSSSGFVSMSTTNVFSELLDNEQLLKSQYNLIAGKWPTKYNEVVLLVNENNEIADYTLYTLGLKNQSDLKEKFAKLQKGEQLSSEEQSTYDYDEILNLSFKLLLNTDYYKKENNMWIDCSANEEYIKQKIADAEEIKIVGILRQNEETVSNQTTGIIGYTKDLKEYVINKNKEQEIVKEQLENKDINVFTKMEFPSAEENESISTSGFDYSKLTNEQKQYMSTLSQEEIAKLMQTYSDNMNATYDNNLVKLGYVDLEKPSSISIYPINFEAKEKISDAIEEYNDMKKNAGKEDDVISYTDLVGIMMTSVTTIINVVSYVLIAFVAISLVVSSIMIGIITYISVLERIKEIGILRAMGASKKDISRVFNAETFIIGATSGIIGILVTIALNIPINLVIKSIVGISNISTLPVIGAIILVIISMMLTVIAGLIPAKIASKKDPVIALRTE